MMLTVRRLLLLLSASQLADGKVSAKCSGFMRRCSGGASAKLSLDSGRCQQAIGAPEATGVHQVRYLGVIDYEVHNAKRRLNTLI